MNPLEQVNGICRSLERRLRWGAFTRGAAVTAFAALIATVLLVLYTNAYAFSDSSLLIARVLLVIMSGAGRWFRSCCFRSLSLNRRRAAKRSRIRDPRVRCAPAYRCGEGSRKDDPFLELLAADTMEVAQTADSGRVVSPTWLFGSASSAAFASLGLIWLILAGPGFMGHGASTVGGSPERRYASRIL